MAKQHQALFLVLSVSYLISSELATAAGTSKNALNFIQSSCKTTTFRSLCVDSLSVYANTIQTSPRRLVESAIAVSLEQARSTKLFVSHLRKSQFRTLQDCAPSADVFVSDLTNTVQELERCNTWTDCLFGINNAEVSTSSALSYLVENTCSGLFSGLEEKSVRSRISGLVKKSLVARISKLGKEINNAKSLFKAFANANN